MSDRIGSAEWIHPAAVAEKFPYSEGAFWLGRTIDRQANPIGMKDDRHILVVGGTRGGKGTTMLVNNLCLWPGSAIVIDPKGENATITAARRAGGGEFCDGMGQAVHVLDPYRVAHVPDELRGTFNPLDWLDANDPYATKKAERLATSLVPFKDKDEDYWDNEARGLLGALFLHVATEPLYEGRRTLMTVRDLVMRGDTIAYELAEQEGEYIDPPIDLLWEMMILNEVCNGYVRDQGTYFRDLMRASAKQWTGIRGAVKVATDFINSPGMRESLASSSFSFNDLKSSEQGTTVYLSIPQDFINTDRGWMRMMVDITTTQAKLTPGQPRCGCPTLMMLDEFAGLERMDVLEQSIAQLAGYGVKMVCVVQNLAQLKNVYKDSWETFVSGAGVKIFFAVEDNFTREYVSKQVGETEIIREGQSVNESQAENESETKGQSKTKGRSTNRSKTTNRNWGRGKGWNLGLNTGSSRGVNYDKDGGLMNLFPAETGTNRSGGSGLSGGINRNKNWSEGLSETQGTGTNESVTENHSVTRGTTLTQGTGRSESFHKRYLIEPHDVGFKFARVDDIHDVRYPGVALVMISGERPMPIRKCNYFEDPAFHQRFEPHPDHDFSPLTLDELERPFAKCIRPEPPAALIEVRMPEPKPLRMAFNGSLGQQVVDIPVKEGTEINTNQPAIRWMNENQTNGCVEPPPPICSPVNGVVYKVFYPNRFNGYAGIDPVCHIEPSDPLEGDVDDQSSRSWGDFYRRLQKSFHTSTLNPWLTAVACIVGALVFIAVADRLGAWATIPILLFAMFQFAKPLLKRSECSQQVPGESEDIKAAKKATVEEIESTINVRGYQIAGWLLAFAMLVGFTDGWVYSARILFWVVAVRFVPDLWKHTSDVLRLISADRWNPLRAEPLIEIVENDSDQPSLVDAARLKRITETRQTYRYDRDQQKFCLVKS